MNKRSISAQEAISLAADDETDSLPYRVINDAGRSVVTSWIAAASAAPESENAEHWAVLAERASNTVTLDEPIFLEMPAELSATGCTQSIELRPEHFDWHVDVLAEMPPTFSGVFNAPSRGLSA